MELYLPYGTLYPVPILNPANITSSYSSNNFLLLSMSSRLKPSFAMHLPLKLPVVSSFLLTSDAFTMPTRLQLPALQRGLLCACSAPHTANSLLLAVESNTALHLTEVYSGSLFPVYEAILFHLNVPPNTHRSCTFTSSVSSYFNQHLANFSSLEANPPGLQHLS